MRVRSSHRLSSDFREGSEGRNLVHYAEEGISLIGTDSESLFSELLQHLVADDEAPEHLKVSENVARPRSVAPASSSVYSEIGEPPESVDNLNETPGTQRHCEVSQDSRTLTHPGSFERLLESFPKPPGYNQTARRQSFSQVHSDALRVPPKYSAQANTSTLASSQIKPSIGSPRTSRFSEDLGDSNPIGEQGFSSICIETHTSALDNCGLGSTSTCPGIASLSRNDTSAAINTRNISPRAPSVTPRPSFRDLHLSTDYHEGQQVSVESSHQAQRRSNRYTIFPESPLPIRPIGYLIRRQPSFHTIFEGYPSPRETPRYYKKSPLRISTRPSTISFNSGRKSTPKHKRALKRFGKKLKHLLCPIRKRTSSALNH